MCSGDITVLVMIGCGILIGVTRPWRWNWFSCDRQLGSGKMPIWIWVWMLAAVVLFVYAL